MCPHSGYVCCFIGETPDKHGALESWFPVGFYRGIDPHSFGGSAMTAESNYDAEPITWWTCLQRPTKYVKLAVYIHI